MDKFSTFANASKKYFDAPKWNFGRFAAHCDTIPGFPTEKWSRLRLVEELWVYNLDNVVSSSDGDQKRREIAVALLADRKQRRVTFKRINLLNANNIVAGDVNNLNITNHSFSNSEAGAVCLPTPNDLLNTGKAPQKTNPGWRAPPPPYPTSPVPDAVSSPPSLKLPDSPTVTFSAFDNLSGDENLPSTVVLSPASSRHWSPHEDSSQRVKRPASTSPHSDKRRRLNGGEAETETPTEYSLLRDDFLSLRQEVHTFNAHLSSEVRSLHDRLSTLTSVVMEIKEMLAER